MGIKGILPGSSPLRTASRSSRLLIPVLIHILDDPPRRVAEPVDVVMCIDDHMPILSGGDPLVNDCVEIGTIPLRPDGDEAIQGL